MNWLTVVGVGEDGWDGLAPAAQRAVRAAQTVFGGARHLALIPDAEDPTQERVAWPHPFDQAYDLIAARRGTPVCVLASGDPMLFGVGVGLAQRFDPSQMRVLPGPSAFSLAAARLGWALQDATPLSVHGRPLALVQPHLHDGAKLLILANDGRSAAQLADVLCARGFGSSSLVALSHMGGPRESRREARAADWGAAETPDLTVLAVDCRSDAASVGGWSRLAGLPDAAFQHDGQLTKRDVRAITLARLGPRPGETLWDVGAGGGSIAIEWLRSDARCRAVAVESDPGRCALIRANREALGVPSLVLVEGRAPEALAELPAPDAVFIGGGVTLPGVVERCWAALRPGGRLVANAVTLDSEAALYHWSETLGGDLTRVSVAQAAPLGRFQVWRPAMPITLWRAVKPREGC